MKVKVIRNEEEYDAALLRIDGLMNRARPGTDEGDELDLLVLVVNAYEEKAHPMPASTPTGAIRFKMDQLGLKNRDLEPYIGPASRVSEVLNGKRGLTIAMIRRLHAGLRIPLESLLGSSGTQATAVNESRRPYKSAGSGLGPKV